MAWFINHYTCYRCGQSWCDDWSCVCDDECPYCEARHISAEDREDLTYIVAERNGRFVVLYSPDTAEHSPGYIERASFRTREGAEAAIEYMCVSDELIASVTPTSLASN